MMNYVRRRFSTQNISNESTDAVIIEAMESAPHSNNTSSQSSWKSTLIPYIDLSNHSLEDTSYPNALPNAQKDFINHQTEPQPLSSNITLKEKSKLLFIIDDEQTDWSKYFKNKKIFADYNIDIEQAQFKEISLVAYSEGGTLIHTHSNRNGKSIFRSFNPDFVLVRQHITDLDTDWINIIIGLQYAGVPSINSIRALYNFRDKPWVFAELLKMQQRLGIEQFPLIQQTYYPNHQKMFISPRCPSVIKVGRAHRGLGKIKIENSYEHDDMINYIAISKSYSTIEPYIHSQCDIHIQKIGHVYKAFSRKVSNGEWKSSAASYVIEQIDMNDRYRLWIDEVSQIFGGLDICAVEAVRSAKGKEYVIDVNDCTMPLLNETKEEDCQLIANLVMHKMQIYCRPDQKISVLTRIPSYDELPKLPPDVKLDVDRDERAVHVPNTTNIQDTFTNLRKVVAKIFSEIIS